MFRRSLTKHQSWHLNVVFHCETQGPRFHRDLPKAICSYNGKKRHLWNIILILAIKYQEKFRNKALSLWLFWHWGYGVPCKFICILVIWWKHCNIVPRYLIHSLQKETMLTFSFFLYLLLRNNCISKEYFVRELLIFVFLLNDVFLSKY